MVPTPWPPAATTAHAAAAWAAEASPHWWGRKVPPSAADPRFFGGGGGPALINILGLFRGALNDPLRNFFISGRLEVNRVSVVLSSGPAKQSVGVHDRHILNALGEEIGSNLSLHRREVRENRGIGTRGAKTGVMGRVVAAAFHRVSRQAAH